jgi:hypothetical protein
MGYSGVSLDTKHAKLDCPLLGLIKLPLIKLSQWREPFNFLMVTFSLKVDYGILGEMYLSPKMYSKTHIKHRKTTDLWNAGPLLYLLSYRGSLNQPF